MLERGAHQRHTKAGWSTVLAILGVVLGLGIVSVVAHPARVALAAGPVDWGSVLNLSSTTSASSRGEIVADGYGHVHVFWREDLGGAAVVDRSNLQTDERFNVDLRATSIMHREWDGAAWSNPVDLFSLPTGDPGVPVAAVDDDNQIYLLMDRADGIYFSTAPAHTASSAAAWSKEWRIIDASGGLGPGLVARGHGLLDMVFGAVALGGTTDGNVYHMRSTDGGKTWSEPHRISQVNAANDRLSVWARIAVDGQGTLHTVWTQIDNTGITNQSVWYSRSTDEGNTWSTPLLVDESHGTWINARGIQIVAAPDGKIHLIWVCGEQAFRCHQVSGNGGESWGARERIFGEMASFANLDAVTTDRQTGTVYLVLQLRPSALYYSVLEGERWLDPPLLVDKGWLHEGHDTKAAALNGNELHVVTNPPGTGEVGYIRGVNHDQPGFRPKPTPTSSPTNTPPATSTAVLSVTPVPTLGRVQHDGAPSVMPDAISPASGSANLSLSLAPVVVLLVGFLAFALLRAR